MENNNPAYLSERDIKVILPPFNPQSPDSLNAVQWIELVEKERTRRRWDDSITLLYASVRLKETVKDWFMDNVCGWPELKLKLLRDFPDSVNKVKLFAQMMRRRKRPTESYEDYIINVGRVARKCNLNMTTTIRCIIAGLDDEKLKDHLLARSCQTISEVLTQIRLFSGQQRQGDLANRSHNSMKRLRLQNAIGDGLSSQRNQGACSENGAEDCKDLLKIVRVGDVYLTAFIDLASRCTTLRLSEAERHGWRMQNSDAASLSVSADVVGKLTENVKADNVEMVTDVVVVKDNAQDFPMILGRNFLNNPGVCVLKTFNDLEIKYVESGDVKTALEQQKDSGNGEQGDEVDQEVLAILEYIERDCL